MPREIKNTNQISRPKAGIDVSTAGEVALVTVGGLVDEHFAGFGQFGGDVKAIVINVSGMTRMTSFGVRQWLKSMDGLPKTITDIYLLGCPTFFVDQLNMVLNFGGSAQVLTVVAPYTCPSCGAESGETVDVLAERAGLSKGGVSEKMCGRCGGRLEFDETPESYFSFVSKYAASSITPAAAQLLAESGLYVTTETTGEKPPKIIKLVHGSVTYFRIIGVIGSMFRARPLLVGAEGEIVIDLAEVDRFDPLGQREWRRLLKTLAAQVPAVTLVDVTESFLQVVGDSVSTARNLAIHSVLVPYRCIDCDRVSMQSVSLEGTYWPFRLGEQVCPTCGGVTRFDLPPDALAPLQKADTRTQPASSKLVAQRAELLSRALTDANVAQAGDSATPTLGEDTILGKYKIVRKLSAGGMAEVFLAKQVGIGGFEKPVALKRIQRQMLDSRHLAIDMFLNEAKIAGRLMHPNIVQVLDVGEVGGALYLAMEYVRGKDLREILKKLRDTKAGVPLPLACLIIHEVAQALHHAYWSTDMSGQRLAVVHRDVSPHNIILSYEGTVKLLDFGVAMSAVTEQAEKMVVGKWQYMSPEHSIGQQLDHRSDLFSLGVITYLLCSNKMPFSGNDPKELVRKVRAGNYTPLEQVVHVPEPLAQLVSRMLAANPAERPETGREVAATLNEIMRTYGLDCSATHVAQFVGDVFPEERDEPRSTGPVDIQRMTPSNLGAQLSPPGENSPSPIRTTGNRLAPGSISTPVPGSRQTPVNLDGMSLARRSQELSAPIQRQDLSQPVPTMPPMKTAGSGSALRNFVVAFIILVAAVAAYIIIHPK